MRQEPVTDYPKKFTGVRDFLVGSHFFATQFDPRYYGDRVRNAEGFETFLSPVADSRSFRPHGDASSRRACAISPRPEGQIAWIEPPTEFRRLHETCARTARWRVAGSRSAAFRTCAFCNKP